MSFPRYSSYKDSGVEWLGDVPEHWEYVRFKNVFDEKNSIAGSLLPPGSISFGRVIFKDAEFLHEPTKASYQEVLSGEFLINPINLNFDLKSLRTALSEIDTCVSPAYIVLKPKVVADKNYLKYQLHAFDLFHMKTLGAGVRQTITFGDIGACFTFQPPLHEQTRIATFLDHETTKIDELVAAQRQLIELLKEKRHVVISHAVTKGLNPDFKMKDSGVAWLGLVPENWAVLQFRYMVSIQNGSDYKHIESEDGLYPVIGSGGEFKRATDYIYDGISVLLGRKGSIDKPLYIEGKFWVVDTMFYTIIKDIVIPKYVFNCAKIIPFDLLSTSTALPSMTQNDLKAVYFALPNSLKEQESITNYIDEQTSKIDVLTSEVQRAIDLLQERRTSLISAAVTGQIDVRSSYES